MSGSLVAYRVVCSCQDTPFYEGDDEWTARRFFASVARAASECGPQHAARLQRAVFEWADVPAPTPPDGGTTEAVLAPDHAGRDVTRAEVGPTQREEMGRG